MLSLVKQKDNLGDLHGHFTITKINNWRSRN